MTNPYDHQFYDARRAGACLSAEVLVPLVLDLLPCSSVLDVGCGTGTWLEVFERHGVEDVFGIDGPWVDAATLEIKPDCFQQQDLEQHFALGRTFDLVVSLEVAEHLPKSAAPDFVRALVSHAPIVLFSAAVPHQGGENHVNEQWPEYWAALFADHGFLSVDCLRRKLWVDDRVDWWYAQNAVLYVQREALEELPQLQREYRNAGGVVPSLVHPHRYLQWVNYGVEQNVARWEGIDG